MEWVGWEVAKTTIITIQSNCEYKPKGPNRHLTCAEVNFSPIPSAGALFGPTISTVTLQG